MARTYYHYTDSESLVRILKENLLRSSEGSGVSSHAADSVFFTKKVLNKFKNADSVFFTKKVFKFKNIIH